MTDTDMEEVQQWLTENISALFTFLQSADYRAINGSLNTIAELVSETAEHGTDTQAKALYLFLITTRAQLREAGQDNLRGQFSKMTRFLNQNRPATFEIDEAILREDQENQTAEYAAAAPSA